MVFEAVLCAQVFKLGVTQTSKYSTPNLDYMVPGKRKVHLAERAFVALFIAAHRGHLKLVEKLIAEGKRYSVIKFVGNKLLCKRRVLAYIRLRCTSIYMWINGKQDSLVIRLDCAACS